MCLQRVNKLHNTVGVVLSGPVVAHLTTYHKRFPVLMSAGDQTWERDF